ncbi:translation initiation factor IF-2-like [Pollicipes pollicipes]|uniref:translation initiation factor IF-2-like n=1 Tax=Pollicipes pollicipes TaxID=41117 RepID=UPI0018852F0A|nr:translation initiation factor IF-2-like [Pollicipes pollicipes]
MRLLIVLALVAAVRARPEKLDGLGHDHHHHDHEHDHAAGGLGLPPPPPPPAATDEPAEGPHPYSFSYDAGRFPNHVDRSHSETRNEDGTVVGSFQYLDPLKRLVKVAYTADETGFHSTVEGAVPDALPRESDTVAAARDSFFAQVAKIMAEHDRIGKEHARLRAAKKARLSQDGAKADAPQKKEDPVAEKSRRPVKAPVEAPVVPEAPAASPVEEAREEARASILPAATPTGRRNSRTRARAGLLPAAAPSTTEAAAEEPTTEQAIAEESTSEASEDEATTTTVPPPAEEKEEVTTAAPSRRRGSRGRGSRRGGRQ